MLFLRLTLNLLRNFSYYSEFSNIKSSVFSILKKKFPKTQLPQPKGPRHISAALASQPKVGMCLYNKYVMEGRGEQNGAENALRKGMKHRHDGDDR